MKDSCGCGHCHCGEDNPPAGGEKTPEDKIAALRKAITDLGYNVKENDESELIISEYKSK